MDCEHLAVELDSQPVKLINTITVAHWFTCIACRTKAVVIEHQAVLKTK